MEGQRLKGSRRNVDIEGGAGDRLLFKKKKKTKTNVSVRFNDVLKVMADQEVATFSRTPSLQLATEHR